MSEKKSLLLYYNYSDHFAFLTDEQLGRLIRAMFDYEINRVVPEFDEPVMKMCFSFVQSNLDRDLQKYIDKCSKNSENGKRGGRPKKQNEQIDNTSSTANEASSSQSQSLNDSDDTTGERKRHFLQTYGNM